MSHYFKPYVPVAERRRKADKKVAALRKKGEAIEPVHAATPRGKIASSFWGQAWCEHLESYSDFANRLPRGRTYLRNGSVLHLGIEKGAIHAMVMGSELYRQTVCIDPMPKDKWKALKQRCQGGIGSLVELLQGKLSDEIMKIVTDRKGGLFPAPKEIRLNCSCPDWADLCKHLAAVLYGVGARLDDAPELLFKLRGVDHAELVQTDTSSLVSRPGPGAGRRRLSAEAVGDVFGIEMVPDDQPDPVTKTETSIPAPKKPTTDRKPARSGSKKAVQSKPKKPARPKAKKPAQKRPARKAPTQEAANLTKELKRIAKEQAKLEQARARLERKIKGNKPKSTPSKRSGQQSSIPFSPTGSNVRQLRERLNLNRSAFASVLGVSAPTVANWEAKPGPINPQARSLAALRNLHKDAQSR